MKFCFITTFFGNHSFGGDAVFVDRLARALLRPGHTVDIIYDIDAFEIVRGDHPLRPYTPPQGLKLHALKSPFGSLSPLWTHQTGSLGYKRNIIQKILDSEDFDVIHFHNISLVGGVEVLYLNNRNRNAIKLMTAHEHWLVCPLSLLWKFDQDVCDQPQCIRCTLNAGRPPQLWRYTKSMQTALNQLDALIFPSQHTLEIHRQRGIKAPLLVHLPYFLPQDWAENLANSSNPVQPNFSSSERPYFAAVGRLVKEKGFHTLIPLMAQLPDLDLKIAGTGNFEGELRQLAANLPNVHFLGLLDFPNLAQLYQEAVALVVPSLFYETFGYVVIEAFSVGTPVIVRDRGALPELVAASGGGITYRADEELLAAMNYLAKNDLARHNLGSKGYQAVTNQWSESNHIQQYLELIGGEKK